MDVLADVLSVARMSAIVVAQAELVPPWGLQIDPIAEAHVHVVLRGACFLRMAGERAHVRLGPGDIVLLRGGVGHTLTDDPKTKPAPHERVLADMPRRLADLPSSRASQTTLVLCAKFLFQDVGAHPLVSLLPPFVHLPAQAAERHHQLPLLLQLLHHEAVGKGSGKELVVPRLVESLLVFVIRAWLEEQPVAAGGWFGAMRDPAIAKALSLIHARPQHSWSVEGLASEVVQSRATFARRFAELVGETPVAYLTRWRMCLATKLLAETQLSLEEVAERIGYESAAAFSKAFRRLHARAPGQFRLEARRRAPVNGAPAPAP